MAFMAPRIEIPELPDDTFGVLNERARAEGMSVPEYAQMLLISAAQLPTNAEIFARAANRPPADVSADEIVALIREGRER